jgi:transposase
VKEPITSYIGLITEALRLQCEEWRMNPVVKALICPKGFDFVAAVAFVAEMGDLTRFAHPRALMAYLGLVPSEFSSGPPAGRLSPAS